MVHRIGGLLLAAALVSCATVGGVRRMQQFNETEAQYRSLLLRSDLASAERMMDADGSREGRLDREEMKLIQITRYDVEETAVSEDKKTVNRLVEIHYYRNDRPVEAVIEDREEWRFDEETGTWLLHSGFPAFP